MNKVMKTILKIVVIVIGVLLLVVGSYLIYLQTNFYRNANGASVDIADNQTAQVETGTEYTALTYNIGFGAYDQSYTCFMDTGVMADGTKTQGEHSWATSEQQMYTDIDGAISIIRELDPDFVCLQEVDVDSDRTYHMDQRAYITGELSGYGNSFERNFHTAYLAYPFNEPLGIVNAGLLTLSRFNIEEATWGSYPIDMGFIIKFTDLDRGFTVNRIQVSDGKQLVLVNSHMSAYDSGGIIRAQQLETLNSFLETEYEKGNYVIVGGDFNQTMGGTMSTFASGQQIPSWVAEFDEADLADGFRLIHADNIYEVPTCRGADIAWEEGVDYTCVIDGFIVSDNIIASSENIDTTFENSDHNPVLLTFSLDGE